MSKLTKEERDEFNEKFVAECAYSDVERWLVSPIEVRKWVEQKKKEWQEEASIKMLEYCRECSDGSIAPSYNQKVEDFYNEHLIGSGIRP